MNDLLRPSPPPALAVPVPRAAVAVRVGTMADVPFMDEMQKKHSRALGYFPTQQFAGYVGMGAVLVAHEPASPDARLGYVISRDRYLKRDELGVVYQLNVVPDQQRRLIGAHLVRAVFDRAAYGCRLFCCWCAQDLAANLFWESLGFVPLAFRAGSAGKRRVHVFWQRRIVDGDVTTPYWYPFQTNSGAIRQDRLVFPLPPGVHWRDVRAESVPVQRPQKQLNDGTASKPRGASKPKAAPPKEGGHLQVTPQGKVAILVGRKLKYVDRPGYVAPTPTIPAPPNGKATAKPKRAPAPKIDPKYLNAARELRDRYLEHANSGRGFYSDSRGQALGKYNVARTLPPAPNSGSNEVSSIVYERAA